MSRPINSANWAENYVQGMNGAQKKYVEGVNAVTESPTAAAARNLEKARRNYNAAIDSGRTANRLNSVSLESWKNQSAKVGGSRIGPGGAAAKPKVQAYAQRAAPFMQQLRDQIRAMPSDTPSDMEARSIAWQRGMRQFAGKE